MVSEEAVEELCKIMEEIARDISKRTVLFAEDAHRLKVLAEDVKNAEEESHRARFLESLI